jgi:hypothetical protein
VRVGYVVTIERGDELSGDAFYYHTAANLLADGKGFIDPFRYVYGGEQERAGSTTPVDDTASTSILPVTRSSLPPSAHVDGHVGVLPLPGRAVLTHQLPACIGALGALIGYAA